MAESTLGVNATAESAAPRQKGSSTVASLELMRGLASIDVFVWHLLNCPSGFPHIRGLYASVAWARESVIVFFVLSGYVIALSQQRHHRSALPFFKARIKRIVPLYLIALAAAIGVGFLINRPSTLWQIVGHLLFLQSYEGWFVQPLPTDGPLWSLGNEFGFYMVVVLILAVRKPALIRGWWLLALAALVIRYTGHFGSGFEGLLLEFLAISPCWLLGYLFAGFGSRYSLGLISALTLFLIIPLVSYSDFGTVLAPTVVDAFDNVKCLLLALLIVPLIHRLAVRQLFPEANPIRFGWIIPLAAYALLAAWQISHPVPHSLDRALPQSVLLALPAAFFVLANLIHLFKPHWPSTGGWFRRIAIFLGGGSYALYVIHTPLSFFVIAWVGDGLLRFVVLVLASAAAVVLLEYVVQPRAAALIDRVWRSRSKS